MTRIMWSMLLVSVVAHAQDPPPQPFPIPLKCGPPGAPNPIVDGTYFLISVSNRNFCLDSATDRRGKIQTFNCNGGDTQKFNFGRRDAANCYAVQVLGLGQGDNAAFLFGTVTGTNFPNDPPTIGAQTVGLFPIPPGDRVHGNFRWDVEAVPNKPGVFFVVSAQVFGPPPSKLCLTAQSDTLPGHDAENDACNGELRQEWFFQLITPTPTSQNSKAKAAKPKQ